MIIALTKTTEKKLYEMLIRFITIEIVIASSGLAEQFLNGQIIKLCMIFDCTVYRNVII